MCIYLCVEVEGDETKDVLAGVTVEEVQTVFDKVAKEMFAGLQVSH